MEFYQKSTKVKKKKSNKPIFGGFYQKSCLIFLTACLAFQLTHQTDTVKAKKNEDMQSSVNTQNNGTIKEEQQAIGEFSESQKDKLDFLRETYETIYYAIGNENDFPFAYINNTEQNGIYYEMCSYFSDVLGIEFEQVEDMDYQTALAKLAENQIQLLTGLLYRSGNEAEFVEKDLIIDNSLISSSTSIDQSQVILVAREGEEKLDTETIPNYYWGAEEQFLSLSNDSILDGHTIVYNSLEEVIHAIEGDEIQGMLVKDKNFAFLVDNSTFNVPMTVLSTSFQVGEHLTYSTENEILNEVLDDLLTIFLNFHPINENEVVATSQYDRSEENTRHVIMIGSSVLGMLAVVLFIYASSQAILTHKRRKKAFKDLEKRLTIDQEEEYELLYIDLGKGKIKSNKNFALFQLNTKRKLLKIRELSKLIGYDYAMHYKNIMIQGEEEFFEEYELYINGVKYHLAEKGVFLGGYFVTAVYEATW